MLFLTPNASAEYSGSTDSYLPYWLRNCKFSPYFTNTKENQKKKEKKSDDNVTIHTSPINDTTGTDTLNYFSQDNSSTDSNYPYSFRYRKFSPYSTDTMKYWKNKENKIDDKDTAGTPNAYTQDAGFT